jgi:hypothetical protein
MVWEGAGGGVVDQVERDLHAEELEERLRDV